MRMKLTPGFALLVVGTLIVPRSCEEYSKYRFQRYYVKTNDMESLSTTCKYYFYSDQAGLGKSIQSP